MAAVDLSPDAWPFVQDRHDPGRLTVQRRRQAGWGIRTQRLQIEVPERDAQPVEGLDLAPDERPEPRAAVGGRVIAVGCGHSRLVQVTRREGHPAAETRGRVAE